MGETKKRALRRGGSFLERVRRIKNLGWTGTRGASPIPDMARSEYVMVRIDLGRVRTNARSVRERTGVPVLAVIKADAYGLGAAAVAEALADVVDGFCVFSLAEAVAINLWNLTGKEAIALAPPSTLDPQPWREAHVRPAVTTLEQAARLAPAGAVLSVDTGMQRFNCPESQVREILATGTIQEAYTHATRIEHVQRLRELTSGYSLRLHAAGSALLDQPGAHLDSVRPGLALYRGAVRVSTRLVEAGDSAGPIGYTGWQSTTGRHGVILAGYFNGLRAGMCVVNGVRRRIPEVGMQSAFVELGPGDHVGDEVVLLGDDLSPNDLAPACQSSPQEALVRLCGLGKREYIST